MIIPMPKCAYIKYKVSLGVTGLINMGPPCLAPSGIVIDDIHAWCGPFPILNLSLFLMFVTKLPLFWLQRLRPRS
jgi:hypothetical protein